MVEKAQRALRRAYVAGSASALGAIKRSGGNSGWGEAIASAGSVDIEIGGKWHIVNERKAVFVGWYNCQ